jgi:16S rRNA (uracil1498-N3)-methyltransferase
MRAAAAHILVADIDSPVLSEESQHHVFRSLRVDNGEIVTITDGRGRWRRCRALGDSLDVDGEVLSETGRINRITIAVAIPKLDRPEWIVQKLTEIGVDRIVFVHAERSVVRWDPDRASKHLGKLRRVAIEAVQQSRSVWLPDIVGPQPSADVLPGAVAAEPGGRELAPNDFAVAIGPEGGWSPAERALAIDCVSFGSTVLRVETAALAAAVRLVAHAG